MGVEFFCCVPGPPSYEVGVTAALLLFLFLGLPTPVLMPPVPGPVELLGVFGLLVSFPVTCFPDPIGFCWTLVLIAGSGGNPLPGFLLPAAAVGRV